MPKSQMLPRAGLPWVDCPRIRAGHDSSLVYVYVY